MHHDPLNQERATQSVNLLVCQNLSEFICLSLSLSPCVVVVCCCVLLVLCLVCLSLVCCGVCGVVCGVTR